jgi:hypothetical protein
MTHRRSIAAEASAYRDQLPAQGTESDTLDLPVFFTKP